MTDMLSTSQSWKPEQDHVHRETIIRLHPLSSPDVSTEVHAESDMVGTLLPQHSTYSFRETVEAGKPLCLAPAVCVEENPLAHFPMKQIITPRKVILP